MSEVGVEVLTTVIVLLIVALLNAILGTLIFLQATNSRVNQLFLVMTYAMALWVVTNVVFLLAESDIQFMSALLSYGAAAWLTISFVRFCNAIVPQKLDSQTMQIITVSTVLLGFASIMPGFIATGVVDGEIQTQTIPLLIYGLAIVAGLFIGNWLLVYAARTAPRQQRKQYRALLLGLVFGAVLGVVCNLILPAFGNYSFVAYGPVGLLVFVSMCVYAIAKHGLFDIRLASVRAVGYAATIICLTALYFIIAYLASVLFVSKFSNQLDIITPVNIVIALILAILFQPIKAFFDRATDRIFYRSQYNTDEFVAALGDALTSTVKLRTMLERASNVMVDTLQAPSVSFVVHREGRADMIATGGRQIKLAREDMDEISSLIEDVEDSVIDIHEMNTLVESKTIRHLLRRHYALILPLGAGLGFVLLRERLGGLYSERDKRVLAAVSDELTIAIQNARSVEGIRELNTTLQQRIDMATKELRRSNQELKRLDEVKDEFVSMASHQLRTPLTSVKGYISMILEGDVGKITPQQKKVLSEAFISSERMVRLIGDFLNVSRLQTGKFMIDAKPIDFTRVVAEEIDSISTMAASHGQEIVYKEPASPIMLTIDEDKTRQVIMNFIDNAIYYSPDSKAITVKLQAVKNRVIFEVHDRGIGVPKSIQNRLFTKFFRADNARKQRPDGTGIGLYLAKQVIEAQGGTIIFHSRPGMGSVFGFSLPFD